MTTQSLLCYTSVGGIEANYNGSGQSFTLEQYTKVENFTADGVSVGGVVPDYANGKVTVTDGGVYEVHMHMSVSSGTANVIVHCAVFSDGVEQSLETERKISAAGDVGSWSMSSPLTLSAGDEVDIRMNPDKTATLTVAHCQFWLKRIT